VYYLNFVVGIPDAYIVLPIALQYWCFLVQIKTIARKIRRESNEHECTVQASIFTDWDKQFSRSAE
jgi:hypothetical protein